MTQIAIDTLVNAPVEIVWTRYTEPDHITQWNFASEDWCCPSAANDLQVGGRYIARMEAKDGSMGFDFGGTYDSVEPKKSLAYTLDDGRRVETTFTPEGSGTRVRTVFDAEGENSEEMQRSGWQAILDNFRRHAEAA